MTGNNKAKQEKITIPPPARLLIQCDRCCAIVNAEFFAAYESVDYEDQFRYRYYFCKCPSCNDPFVAISGNYGRSVE